MLPALNHAESLRRLASEPAGAYRVALAASALMALTAGILAGAVLAPAATADPGLATLLRFMALVKGAIIAIAAALAAWRFGFAIPPKLAIGYTAAVALMALSPGLIWFQSSLVVASAAFHSGLLLGLALAAGDGLAKQRNQTKPG
ncbi:MAG: hypothetical protein MUC37_12385 [Hyphomicrobium sp.]|jgi:hypothetical protein|nr:hypothetical protein [Hyphomicrobium sp.]